MKTNQALIKKEILVLGKKPFVPVWVVAIIYALIILIAVFGFIIQQGKMVNIEGEQMTLREAIQNQLLLETELPAGLIAYSVNYYVALFISFLFILHLGLTTANILNVKFRDNYELFHRAQPVSILRIGYAKFIGIVGSNWSIYFGIIILNFLIMNIFASILLRGIMPWNLWFAFVGMLHWAFPALVITAVLTSIAFLISAICQDSANYKFGGFLAGMIAISLIFNRLFGWHLPNPFSYFISIFRIGLGNFSGINMTGIDFTLPNWSFFLNWKTLVHVMVGAVFFYLGTIIYSKREIKQ